MTFSFVFRFQCLATLHKVVFCVFISLVLSSCSTSSLQPRPLDIAAEQSLLRVQQINADLKQLKCIAKISLAQPGKPTRRLRTAIAGLLEDHLRIDLFAPFGGSAGTFSANGEHLFLVTHPSRDYYKKRFGKGNLHRLVQLDVTVAELLELLVGRIPVHDFFSVRFLHREGTKEDRLVFFDRWGNVGQRIYFGSSGKAYRGEWLDKKGRVTRSVALRGERQINAFQLAQQIELSDASGHCATIFIERYETNVILDKEIFTITPPSS